MCRRIFVGKCVPSDFRKMIMFSFGGKHFFSFIFYISEIKLFIDCREDVNYLHY